MLRKMLFFDSLAAEKKKSANLNSGPSNCRLFGFSRFAKIILSQRPLAAFIRPLFPNHDVCIYIRIMDKNNSQLSFFLTFSTQKVAK